MPRMARSSLIMPCISAAAALAAALAADSLAWAIAADIMAVIAAMSTLGASGWARRLA
jgi:hypothetical protein